MLKVLFFASLREKLGVAEEEIIFTEELSDIAALRQFFCQRGGVWQDTLGTEQKIMTAINQTMVDQQQSLNDGDEVAFFPPVTGG